MKHARNGIGMALCLVVVSVAAAAAQSIDLPAAASEAADLLGRLQQSQREDLLDLSELTTASIGEGIAVHGYPDLTPRYTLHPIMGAEEVVIGLVAVDARTGIWSWYTFGYRGSHYPPVSAATASVRAQQHAAGLGMTRPMRSPRIVAPDDKHLYWLVEGDGEAGSCQIFVEIDDAGAPTLSTLDASWPAHVAALPAPVRLDAAPLDHQPPSQSDRPLPRPDLYVIPNVPYCYQVTEYSSGLAVAKTVMDYCGEEISQAHIADVANEQIEWGVQGDDLRRACHFSSMSTAIQNPVLRGYYERSLGYAANQAWLWSNPYNYAKDTIFQGFPLLVWTCLNQGCAWGHFRVVKGYDDTLNEFIVNDPYYMSPFWGPEVHFNQQFFVEELWDPWWSCWAVVTSPWVIDVTMPDHVRPREAFDVVIDIHYPGPGPFAGQYMAFVAHAEIYLPPTIALIDGDPLVYFSSPLSGESRQVTWRLMARSMSEPAVIGFKAQGMVSASSYSYPTYTDTIGGHATALLWVGEVEPSAWTDDERVTVGEASSVTCSPHARAMYVDADGTAHIVWADGRDGNSEIYYRRWAGTWGPEVRLTIDPGYSDNPAIASGAAGDLHVVWSDTRAGRQEIFYKSYDGSSWSEDLQLTTNPGFDLTPAIAVDGLDRVHVVWQGQRGTDYQFPQIYYRMWDGDAWTTEASVGGQLLRSAYSPSIAAGETGHAHLVYGQDHGGRVPGEVYYREQDDSGWSDPLVLTEGNVRAHCPSIAMGPGADLHVVWNDGSAGGGDIRYRKRSGGEWSDELEIEDLTGDAEHASVVVDTEGTVHIVWEDYTPNNAEIYHKQWDGDWSEAEKLTDAPNASILPCIGVDAAGQCFLVWTDSRDGNSEIYFKRRPGSAVAVPAEFTRLGDPVRPELIRALWPVPARGSTTLEFRLPFETHARVQIFDVCGRAVRTLLHRRLDAGVHRVLWDGRDDRSHAVASGTYYYRLEADARRETRRVVIVGR